jgi:SAM-dependent methyltransferase
MKEFWNNRYKEESLAYGSLPNAFLKSQLDILPVPGHLLLPCEGEGRNAIYAALHGWRVDAFDYSNEAQQKALKWAIESQVNINFEVSDITEYIFEQEKYDVIAFIYAHFPEDLRIDAHHKAIESLKTGGKIILEAFNPRQLGKNSGGPKHADLLYTTEMLKRDFSSLEITYLEEKNVFLDEGLYHHGQAEVIRLVAHKIE